MCRTEHEPEFPYQLAQIVLQFGLELRNATKLLCVPLVLS